MRILLVDDELDILDCLENALKPLHYFVYKEPDPVKALELIKKTPIDLVVTDLCMYGMTGTQLVKAIKAYDSKIPVIMITAYDNLDQDLTIDKEQLTALFPKPLDIEEFITTLKNLDIFSSAHHNECALNICN